MKRYGGVSSEDLRMLIQGLNCWLIYNPGDYSDPQGIISTKRAKTLLDELTDEFVGRPYAFLR